MRKNLLARPRSWSWVEIGLMQRPLVQEAFELMAKGEYSLRKLLALVAKRGLRFRNGMPLQATDLWEILTNAFYVGRVGSNGKAFPGSPEPLVDELTFDEAQSRIAARGKKGTKPQ